MVTPSPSVLTMYTALDATMVDALDDAFRVRQSNLSTRVDTDEFELDWRQYSAMACDPSLRSLTSTVLAEGGNDGDM